MTKWNWELDEWPHFTYDAARLQPLEAELIRANDIILALLFAIPKNTKQDLTADILRDEALYTSEIEGEYLDPDRLHSSIRKQFGLTADNKNIPKKEQGIATIMVDIHNNFRQPLTQTMLNRWHDSVMQGDLKLPKDHIGRYRKTSVYIVSFRRGIDQIIYEAPPAARVKPEMSQFITWFNQTAPTAKNPLPAIQRAAIAHLYFETIHPYADGNGRIGRAIAEKSLAQCLKRPTLIALAKFISDETNRREYYAALRQTNHQIQINDWLTYFANAVIKAQQDTTNQIKFIIAKIKLMDKLRGLINHRQQKVLLRIFKEGPQGFAGGLSSENYTKIAKTSAATATRDLNDLVSKHALTKTGEKRYTRYYLNLDDE